MTCPVRYTRTYTSWRLVVCNFVSLEDNVLNAEESPPGLTGGGVVVAVASRGYRVDI